ncbi:MAG: cytidine deaminase [Clostridia bacterium]|nr:cytidine deaminase [Clostridia bacterium]
MTDTELIRSAVEASRRAYAPYSGCNVGAALFTASGKVYTGCNIENASFSLTVCAERTAFFKAVADGEKEFVKIAVTGNKGGKSEEYFYPCGACRQVMAEFCGEDFVIITAKGETDYLKTTLKEFLPDAFNKSKMR